MEVPLTASVMKRYGYWVYYSTTDFNVPFQQCFYWIVEMSDVKNVNIDLKIFDK